MTSPLQIFAGVFMHAGTTIRSNAWAAIRSARVRVLMALAISVAALISPLASTSLAAQTSGFGVTPYAAPGSAGRSSFFIEAKPGESVSDRISVSNYSDKPIAFRFFSSDAYNTAVGSAFSLRMPDPETGVIPTPVGVGKWVTIPVEQLIVAPGARSDIPFTLTVPLDAEPGDHAGGIVALDPSTSPDGSGGMDIAVRQAVGVRIYVRVAGQLSPNLMVAGLTVSNSGAGFLAPITGPSKTLAKFSVANVGNMSLTPSMKVTVTDTFGREVASKAVADAVEVLPGQIAAFEVDLGDLSGIGPKYEVSVSAQAGEVGSQASTSFWVFPWLFFLLLVLGLVLLVLARMKRRRSGPSDSAPPAGTSSPSSPAMADSGSR
jgi:hypothetical protein